MALLHTDAESLGKPLLLEEFGMTKGNRDAYYQAAYDAVAKSLDAGRPLKVGGWVGGCSKFNPALPRHHFFLWSPAAVVVGVIIMVAGVEPARSVPLRLTLKYWHQCHPTVVIT